ncbi:MAG: M16 family metallopeptidase [Janthinobacterium lividum]
MISRPRLMMCLALCLALPFAAPAQGAEAVRATLPNGLRVVVVPDTLAPVVSTQLAYLVGSNDAPAGFPGTAHALEHMMFRGSAGLDREQLFELSAQLGGAYNASTAETVTQYTYTVPANDLPLVLRIEALRMRGASITEADWQQERGAIEQEVSRNLSNPAYLMQEAVQSALFAGSPYEHDALGTRPSFDRTDAALLRRFYDDWYAPNNAILVIAGAVDPAEAIRQATEAFAGVSARPVPAHAAVTLPPLRPTTINMPTSQPFGTAALALRMPGFSAADFAAADILGDVLGSERGALYGLVPAGKAIAAFFNYQAMPDAGIGMVRALFAEGADPAPLLDELRQVLAQAAGSIDPDLVEAAKRAELAQLQFASDSIAGLARIWARTLAVQGLQSPDDLARAYAAVTPADVQRMARLLLDPAGTIPVVLTPGPGAPRPSAAGFSGTESFAAPPDRAVTLPDWATVALAALAPDTPLAPPVVSTLPNGLRLIVQPEQVSGTVTVAGRVRTTTETSEPPGQEGVAALMGRLFEYGTEQRDRLATRKALDDITAEASAGTSFALRVLAPDFDRGMALLAENELHPAFPADALAVARRQLVEARGGIVRSPDYQTNRALTRALVPADDPTLRQPTPESLAKLSRADVLAYYARVMRPDQTTIVVVGDVTPEAARRVVEANFGGWRNPAEPAAAELPAIGPNPAATVRIPDPGALQDRVTLAQTLPMSVLDPARYPLLLGNVVLGGGFSSRLYRDLRVRTGYVYSVSSALDWSRTRGRYEIAFGADPDKVAAARALAVQNIKAMQDGPVSEADLSRAKSQILRQFPMQQASVGGIAGLYLRLAELGQPLNAVQIASERYRTMTAADIQAAFRTWLRPDELVEVVRGPTP